MSTQNPQVYVGRLHILAQINQSCPTVFFDSISVFTPRHFRCWAAGDLTRQAYRVRHLYSTVAQTHSELWGHVGACLLVVLDTAATARLFMSVKAGHTNISLKQPSSLHKAIKHLHVNLTGFGQFMYNLEVV
jgi:hypothetical protein